MKKILIVDNSKDSCKAISLFLRKNDYAVSYMNSGLSAVEWLKTHEAEVILCDFGLKDIGGIELLDRIKETHPQAIVIVMADQHSVKDVVSSFKSGARGFIIKPLISRELLLTINSALAKKAGETIAIPHTQDEIKTDVVAMQIYDGQYMTGNSLEYAEIIKQVALVAPTNFSVIIYGESGSGKEAIARQIHQGSKRAGPFVAIDCGALSKELAGSELFGHEKGAFTGALNQKIGSLEAACGGTIFMDEIGNLPYEIQVSLLRVIQERSIRRVGGIKDIAVDIRIIVASNVNLWEAAKDGKFREDLYHRFNEFSIAIPSLRERKQDILLLAHHFLKHTNAELGKSIKGFTKEVEYLLNNYIWHGNIRELKNVIKRATLLANGDLIEVRSLPIEITDYFTQQYRTPILVKTESQGASSNFNTYITYALKTRKVKKGSEYEVTTGVLNQHNQNVPRRLKNGAMFDICIPAN